MRHRPLADLAATDALGAQLAGIMRPGDTILLEGPLGAGKSALARALLRALSGDPDLEVPSPTFTLLQTYETPLGAVAHYDLWRLERPAGMPADVRELGWDDADAWLVEWPDRLGPLRPDGALTVTLSYDGRGRLARLDGWEDRL